MKVKGIGIKGYKVDKETGKLVKSGKGMNLCQRIKQRKSKKISVAKGVIR